MPPFLILATYMPDYDALALEFITTVKAILKQHYPLLFEQAYGDASAVLGVDVSFDLANPFVQQTLDDLLTADYIGELGANLLAAGRQIIGDGLAVGQTVEEIAAALQERGVAESQTRAEQISHTETARAYSRGSQLAWRQSGVVDRQRWITTEPCPICADLDGKIVGLDEEFAPGIRVPSDPHPRCKCALIPVLKEA